MLGVPVVASFVGGVTNRIEQGKDGYLYPLNEVNMLAYYIDQIFSDEGLAVSLSKTARKNARILNNEKQNIETLENIYREIVAQNSLGDRNEFG